MYIRNKHRELYSFFFLCRYSPNRGQATSLLRFIDHTLWDTYTHTHTHTPGRTPLVTGVTNYMAQNKFKRRTPFLTTGFEPAIHQSEGRRPTPQTTRRSWSETNATCESCIDICYNLWLVTQNQQNDRKRIKHTSLNERRRSERLRN